MLAQSYPFLFFVLVQGSLINEPTKRGCPYCNSNMVAGVPRTWGSACFGGDSSDVRGQLKDVKQIQAASGGSFAAILGDGSVVTWGFADD